MRSNTLCPGADMPQSQMKSAKLPTSSPQLAAKLDIKFWQDCTSVSARPLEANN